MKNNFYKVIDNIISVEEQDQTLSFLYDSEFPWFVQKETSGYPVDDNSVIVDKMTSDTIGFVHLSYDRDKGANSFTFEPLLGYLKNFLANNNNSLDELIRIKINMTLTDTAQQSMYHRPHVDTDDNHYVMIYYVNDSDGPTYLFNNKYNGEIQNLEIADKIFPKKGRALIFNGRYYHASSSPVTSKYRIVVNYNFTTKYPFFSNE